MTAITLTSDLSRAAAQDAANRQMREAGRTVWSMEDYNLATAEFGRLEDARVSSMRIKPHFYARNPKEMQRMA